MDSSAVQNALSSFRPHLLRFARLQLRSDTNAEDVVQEALLAALENAGNFKGEAALKTWVFAILRNKIIDEFRRSKRNAETPLDDDPPGTHGLEGPNGPYGADNPDGICQAVFDSREHWVEAPSTWGNPDAALEQKRFWAMFETCLESLPASNGRVFMMREFLGLETAEICKELGISSSNCWVLLHRARLGLRECLDQRWFGNPVERRK